MSTSTHTHKYIHTAQIMAANNMGDVKESAMQQPLLSPEEPLVVVVLGCGQVSSQLRNVTSPWYLNSINNLAIVPLHEQHRPNFIFMDDNAPSHRGGITREQPLETGSTLHFLQT
ncbi:hypothetical protein CHARACLAT_002442 [Characodon lateralis]|uniref:Uncharacterized protein n=1 Tax=Characodon lateralis TaxID=208331 RepID=A0ABU7EQT7_9TELE|nr:hypothetical protein [Characodon lateralis]